MRSFLTAACTALLLLALAGCEAPREGGAGHPNQIIVREFSFSPGVVMLDPSFGFSLYRGAPGVPTRQRAASVGRAAAFSVADAIAQELGRLGYDVVRSDSAAAEPGGRALIVTGAFRRINEGQRRRIGAENPSVAVDGEIDLQSGGASPQRLTSFQLDSRQVGGVVGISVQRGVNANAAAARVGAAIGRYVAEAARLNNWPGASR